MKTSCQPPNATNSLRPGGDPGFAAIARSLPLKNPEARRAGEAIRQGLKILGTYPHLGRLVDDLPEHYREWLIDFGNSGYVARYRVDGDAITILAVRHQKEVGYK